MLGGQEKLLPSTPDLYRRDKGDSGAKTEGYLCMGQKFTKHMDSATLLGMFCGLEPRQLLIPGTCDIGVTVVRLYTRNTTGCCQNPEDAGGLTALLSQEML